MLMFQLGILSKMLKYDEHNIYLHFFDRELRNSLGRMLRFNDSDAQLLLSTALLMSDDMPLYVSFSHMYESLEVFPIAIKMAFECEKLGLLRMLTNMRNIDEFMASRRTLYDFDKNRYSSYFANADCFWPIDTYILRDDTTTILRTKIFDRFSNTKSFPDEVKDSLQVSLVKNRQNAITFSFFQETIQHEYNVLTLDDYQYNCIISDIKESISSQYTSRYLDVLDGTIITGIPGFYCYDYLAQNNFRTDYKLFFELFKPLYILFQYRFENILEFRLGRDYKILHMILQWVVYSLEKMFNGNVNKAISIVKKYRARGNIVQKVDDFIIDCVGLYDFINKLGIDMGGIEKMQTRIMLVVATQLELDVMLKTLKSIAPISASLGNLSYFTSVINDSLVYVIKCQMGQSGVGGSILTLEEAIRILAPDFVIMGGIAWGAKKGKQNIGDLIISTQVWDYDIDRVNPDGTITPRGPISPASARLVQMFEVIGATIDAYKINFGLVASGSDLLDNKGYVNKLKENQPEIIGGDMESAGMASVCSRKNVDWVLVKGICDWGYNKDSHKKEYQQIAAENSSKAIISLLTQLTIAY